MGKKKQKGKQKKEKQQAAETPSPLHRAGQILLDQARGPVGRQLLATGLMVAATALAREIGRAPASSSTEPGSDAEPQPAQPAPAAPERSEATALAGLALAALDQFIQHKTAPDKG
ncbi:hypothetical protein RN629_01360 [Sphingomonadaceae bacterium jetA1]|jgi:hypothetical protein|uniref:hypothetical protein n=1 Tax=Facivitalis istanbulensis TaxID=3075838 RepID=UPI00349262CD